MSAPDPDRPTTSPPQILPPPGWYADPWGAAQARWWNGNSWESLNSEWVKQSAQRAARQPWRRFRPYWIAIAVAAVLVGIDWILVVADEWRTVPLLSVSGIMLLAALWWMDRLEPEPADALVLCVAWGATVAAALAGLFNLFVAVSVSETAAAVVAAPIGEEALKGVILLVLVRHRMIDSMIDGAVYAVAVAVGFALAEDLVYYGMAADAGQDELLELFWVRGIGTPFAHPLFTIWMGVTAGYLVTRRPSRPVAWMVGTGSYLFSVSLHALWNGTLVVSEQVPEALWLVGLLFVVLFVATIGFVAVLRRSQAERFEQQVPALAALLSMQPAEIEVFATTRRYLDHRRSLPRAQRADLGRLRWTLHAIASLRSVVPRTDAEMRVDADELEHLRNEADELQRYLFPAGSGWRGG
jgi:RsiW-degrading membrane proteinase PrsW (M82 family)